MKITVRADFDGIRPASLLIVFIEIAGTAFCAVPVPFRDRIAAIYREAAAESGVAKFVPAVDQTIQVEQYLFVFCGPNDNIAGRIRYALECASQDVSVILPMPFLAHPTDAAQGVSDFTKAMNYQTAITELTIVPFQEHEVASFAGALRAAGHAVNDSEVE